MKVTTNGKWVLFVAVAILCLAPCALAQTEELELVGVEGNYYDNIYTAQYYIQVGGSSGPTYGMVCDDFYDEIGVGSSWQAQANTFSTLSQTMFASQSGYAQEYTEALTLAYALLFNTAPGGDAYGSYNYDMIQFAIWAIFDPSAVKAWVNSTDWAAIQSWITWALNNPLSAALLNNFIIWTPTDCLGGGGGKVGGCAGQEFFQYLPEGGTALGYLLLAGVSCFGAMFFRRQVRA